MSRNTIRFENHNNKYLTWILTWINFLTVLIDQNISYISFDKLLICSYLHVIKIHLEFLDPGIWISLGPPKK